MYRHNSCLLKHCISLKVKGLLCHYNCWFIIVKCVWLSLSFQSPPSAYEQKNTSAHASPRRIVDLEWSRFVTRCTLSFLWRCALSWEKPPSLPFCCAIEGCLCACGGYKEEIFTVSWVKEERELRKIPGMAGEGGRLSSGVLAGGVGILIIAAVKSLSSQFSFRSSVRALRLERLLGCTRTHTHIRSQTRAQKKKL